MGTTTLIILFSWKNIPVNIMCINWLWSSAYSNSCTRKFIVGEAAVWRCSVKKVFLEISQNSQENTRATDSFNKVAGLRPATSLKKSPAQVFSYEFCEIS